ncbi:L,D-transpeptidase [Pedococcus sp. NPDC057267]|uniref:L,D-transpeptidase family protein n=1 Tax=Pedococcus sp. NPDC057267 TaxID=3346077 RepID=UPI003636EF5B
MSARPRPSRPALAVAAAALVVLTGCGGAAPSTSSTSTGSSTSTTTTTTPASTTTATTTTTTRPPAPTPTRTTPTKLPTPTATASHRAATTTASSPRCSVPTGVTATQVVLVKGSGSSATVRACRRVSGTYQLELGPYYGHVGLNGVTWSKREGDLMTPAGTFPLRGGFGVDGNPGLAQGWFRVDANDVWVDDPASSLYNTHQRAPASGRWSSAEPLLQVPAYDYAQVVGYNEARVPGKGSAIFFHVDKGRGTAGCISLPTASLLAVFRWERPGAVISIS